MLTRICLIVAIAAALFVGGWNIVKVREKVTTLVSQRDDERNQKQAAKADASKTHAELSKTQDTLKQTQTELTDANAERDKAVETAAVQVKKATELADKLAKTAADRDDAQTKLAAYAATGVPAERVGQLTRQVKDMQVALEIAGEEKMVLVHTVTRLTNQLERVLGNTEYVVKLRPDLRGRIVVVDPKWDFVVLNIGENQGVIEEGELLVSREGKLVAKVIVRSVEKNRCIANILPGWKLGEVIEGDEVTPAHPAS